MWSRVPKLSKIVVALAIVGTGAFVATSASSAATAAGPAKTVVVGSQKLTLCGTEPTRYCGSMMLPLDYAEPTGPKIQIVFHWYPAEAPTSGVAAGTVVPVEGGPGYPSEGSVRWGSKSVLDAGGYSYMYGPLLKSWNLLAVDLRGTGGSTPLNCPALQTYSGTASGAAYNTILGACADALNHHWKNPNGSWVHASDLFTSVPAATDVSNVVKALGIQKIDLYGDSYGSFFAQVFANHFPTMIRSLILDSTYQTQKLPVWYKTTIEAMPADFDNACSNSPACAQAAKHPAWDDIVALTARLRESPISGTVPGDSGSLVHTTMNVVGLVNLLNDAAGDPMIYRAMDAAARALLDENDAAPLLRLYAQRLAFDEDYFGMPVSSYSTLLYYAVSCLDYPQIFNMNAPESTRKAELKAAEAKLPASTFAPFTTAEWLAQDQNTEAFTACLSWPSPKIAEEPPTTGLPILPKSMPVLVLGGQFDTWTPPLGVPQVLAELGGNTRFIELANSTHVVGEDDQACGSALVQEFVDSPEQVQTMNDTCALRVPAIDSVGVYPSSLSNAVPLMRRPGNVSSAADLQLGGVAVETAGDALARNLSIIGSKDHGLYGGTSVARDGGRLIVLTDYSLVPGVTVSGDIHVTAKTLTASLSTTAGATGTIDFHVTWALGQANAMALVYAMSGGHYIAGETFAPAGS